MAVPEPVERVDPGVARRSSRAHAAEPSYELAEWHDTAELEDLADTLTRLRLSNGNRFTGCIPAVLHDVPDNDLGQLGLEVCAGP